MFDFGLIPEEDLVQFIKRGKLDDLMGDLLLSFWELGPEVQFEIVKRLRGTEEVPFEVVKEVFDCSESDALKLVKGEGTEVRFPVVVEGRGYLRRALVVKGTSEIITNLPEKREELEELGGGFAVFFDGKFTGKSYTLAVAVGLRCKEIPEDLAFTGIVDRKGNVYPPENIGEKERVCKENDLRLVHPLKLKNPNVEYIETWLKKEVLDVPFYFTTSEETGDREFEMFLSFVDTDLSALEVFYGIDRELTLLKGTKLSGDLWLKVCGEFYKRVSKLQYGTPRRHIHIAGRMPSALAFGFGILFGSQTPFTFYHFQDGEYIPVKVERVRELKEVVREPKSIRYELVEGGEELAVAVGVAHHTAKSSVLEFMKGKEVDFLFVDHERRGNLSPEEMVNTAKETAGLIQLLREKKDFKRFHFFFSCPVPVAFMIGVAFGHYSPASIYNYEKERGSYEEVLRTEDLRDIREGEGLPQGRGERQSPL